MTNPSLMPHCTLPLALACLVTTALSLSADDTMVPPVPTPTDTSAGFTSPAPLGSSSGNGMIIHGGSAPVIYGDSSVMSSGSAPVIEYSAPTMPAVPLDNSRPVGSYYASHHQGSIEQFQSSGYWAAPQPFDPHGAPDYGSGPAIDRGTQTRYPYYNYRSPWTYQGPAATHHVIGW